MIRFSFPMQIDATTPPTSSGPVTEFDASARLRDSEYTATSEFENRLQTATLQCELAVLLQEREDLRSRIRELEDDLDTRERQLTEAAVSLRQRDRRIDDLIERYETVISAKDRAEDEGDWHQNHVESAITRSRRWIVSKIGR